MGKLRRKLKPALKQLKIDSKHQANINWLPMKKFVLVEIKLVLTSTYKLVKFMFARQENQTTKIFQFKYSF